MATTTNYSFTLPTVGGSQDQWGTDLNNNWTSLDTTLGGVSAAEFSILDGATATTVEVNYLSGVTSAIQTQMDAKAPTASPTSSPTESSTTLTPTESPSEVIALCMTLSI